MKIRNLLLSMMLATGLTTVHADSKTAQLKTAAATQNAGTRVVMLGTGHPGFDSKRAGQAILIVVDKQLYLFDSGPGYMKNFNSLSNLSWMPKDTLFSNDSLYGSINKLFLTHLDSDHTLGMDEFLLRPWVQGRSTQPVVYGPKGTKSLVDESLKSFKSDIDHRTLGSQPSNNTGYKAIVHEIDHEGVVYKDEKVTVSAFKVPHGSWPDGMAYGYRIQTPDKVIVLSGDTRYEERNFQFYKDADILVHEVLSDAGNQKLSPDWQKYMLEAHTTTKQLAKIANVIKPKKLVLNHAIFFGQPEQALVKEVTDDYKGTVILAEDNMIIE